MLISLTNSTDKNNPPPVELVGGKGSSLAKLFHTPGLSTHVPRAFALTVDFFAEWVTTIASTPEWRGFQEKVDHSDITALCSRLKTMCHALPLSKDQIETLEALKVEMKTWSGGLAAVRSSAPEEDGSNASFAGIFETKLGVTESGLEQAVRACFAFLFDGRVSSYGRSGSQVAFAIIVMEMVDSRIAGVAFSANPLNSDLDEMVVDSSWGLGESVVDGSVEADRFLYDKIDHRVIEKKIGTKKKEQRLTKDGVVSQPVDESRQSRTTLSDKQIEELAVLVCLIESTYGMPMDVEWAYNSDMKCFLLQARPITAMYRLDDDMITPPGHPRVLYYDFNIASEATTTTPFTHMDLTLYSKMSSILMGAADMNLFPYNPQMFWFNSITRQYMNLSIAFKFITPKFCSKMAMSLDPYLADIFDSSDCDRKKYRMKKLPKGVNLCNACSVLRKFPLWKMYKTYRQFASNPKKAKENYLTMIQNDMPKIKQLSNTSKINGLQNYTQNLFELLMPTMNEELVAVYVILPVFHKLDKKRREGKTEREREENDALCGGYEGDEIMEMNIAMYRLARKLPSKIWSEYDHDDLPKLAKRIQSNLGGTLDDIPRDFLMEWDHFMEEFGYDGQDQLFVSSPRYVDSPEVLLAKLRHNVGDGIKDPALTQQENLARRREVMALHETEARQRRCLNPFALSKVQKRNSILEHLMWIRNAPKLHLAQVVAAIRAAVLRIQNEMINQKRLDEMGDIFHLSLEEVDTAMTNESMDVMDIIRPRKLAYERAKRATVCPMLIDSRCRILKPDVHREQPEKGILIGAAVSPGVATGRVRIIHSPTERFEMNEVLATVVTGPAWTPLFVGASAVILQIGGVLQHGALCAREYGKPAVSNIDVMANLKTGMMVTVDGNTGTVKILEEEAEGEDR